MEEASESSVLKSSKLKTNQQRDKRQSQMFSGYTERRQLKFKQEAKYEYCKEPKKEKECFHGVRMRNGVSFLLDICPSS